MKKITSTSAAARHNPWDENSKSIQSAQTDEQAAKIVEWFAGRDAKSLAERKATYESLSAQLNIVDLMEAKVELAERALGPWLARTSRQLNSQAQASLFDEPTDQEEDELAVARKTMELANLVSRIQRVFAHELFGPLLGKANIDRAAAEGFSQIAQEHQGFFKEVYTHLAREVVEEDVGAFAGWLQTPVAARAMRSERAYQSNYEGLFAPLFTWMAQIGQPHLRAELLQRIDVYIRSGWAKADLITGESLDSQMPGRQGTVPTSQEASLITRIKNYAQLTSEGRLTDQEEIMEALGDFNNLLNLRMIEAKIGSTGQLSVLGFKEFLSVSKDHQSQFTMAGTGIVDCIMRDAQNPEKLHASFCTAETASIAQSGQWLRHTQALQKLVSDTDLQKTLGIKHPISSLQFTCISQASIYDKTSKGGYAPQKRLRDALTDEPTPELKMALNASALLRAFEVDSPQLARSTDSVANVLSAIVQAVPVLIGSKDNAAWINLRKEMMRHSANPVALIETCILGVSEISAVGMCQLDALGFPQKAFSLFDSKGRLAEQRSSVLELMRAQQTVSNMVKFLTSKGQGPSEKVSRRIAENAQRVMEAFDGIKKRANAAGPDQSLLAEISGNTPAIAAEAMMSCEPYNKHLGAADQSAAFRLSTLGESKVKARNDKDKSVDTVVKSSKSFTNKNNSSGQISASRGTKKTGAKTKSLGRLTMGAAIEMERQESKIEEGAVGGKSKKKGSKP